MCHSKRTGLHVSRVPAAHLGCVCGSPADRRANEHWMTGSRFPVGAVQCPVNTARARRAPLDVLDSQIREKTCETGVPGRAEMGEKPAHRRLAAAASPGRNCRYCPCSTSGGHTWSGRRPAVLGPTLDRGQLGSRPQTPPLTCTNWHCRGHAPLT